MAEFSPCSILQYLCCIMPGSEIKYFCHKQNLACLQKNLLAKMKINSFFFFFKNIRAIPEKKLGGGG